MKTYQDFLEVGESDKERMDFCYSCISEFKSTDDYKIAIDAEEYYAGRNPTIMNYEKFIFNAIGQAVQDVISPNHKIVNKIFKRIIVAQDLTLLGNGVSFANEETKDKMGGDFDIKMYKAARSALVQKAAYCFWNFDHVEVFDYKQFVALLDEEDGTIKAGIRFWQLDDSKPLRATLYELDGYTEFIWRTRHVKENTEVYGEILKPKRAYVIKGKVSVDEGQQIEEYQNYPTFPIVPLYANEEQQSELVGQRGKLDAYDLISSGYVNDEDANFLYWTVSNASGMDDNDLITVLDKLRKAKIAQVEDGQELTPHVIDAPYQGREVLLERLEKQIYRDAMALNTYDIAGGAVTATQIEAAYEPLNQKLDLFEMQLTDCISKLLELAGITDDKPTYTRSKIVNKNEEIQAVLQSAQYTGTKYTTEKLLTILGDKDRIEEVLAEVEQETQERMQLMQEQAIIENGGIPAEVAEGGESSTLEQVVQMINEAAGQSEDDGEQQGLEEILGMLEDLVKELEG